MPEDKSPQGTFALTLYLVMFGTGELIYRKWLSGAGYLVGALIFSVLLVRVWLPRKKA